MLDIEAFFTGQFADVAPSYRWRALGFRFVRSIGKRTPSAYATTWAIEYNVEGSLLTSAAGVPETLFHGLFHLNHEAHRPSWARALKPDHPTRLPESRTTVARL